MFGIFKDILNLNFLWFIFLILTISLFFGGCTSREQDINEIINQNIQEKTKKRRIKPKSDNISSIHTAEEPIIHPSGEIFSKSIPNQILSTELPKKLDPNKEKLSKENFFQRKNSSEDIGIKKKLSGENIIEKKSAESPENKVLLSPKVHSAETPNQVEQKFEERKKRFSAETFDKRNQHQHKLLKKKKKKKMDKHSKKKKRKDEDMTCVTQGSGETITPPNKPPSDHEQKIKKKKEKKKNDSKDDHSTEFEPVQAVTRPAVSKGKKHVFVMVDEEAEKKEKKTIAPSARDRKPPSNRDVKPPSNRDKETRRESNRDKNGGGGSAPEKPLKDRLREAARKMRKEEDEPTEFQKVKAKSNPAKARMRTHSKRKASDRKKTKTTRESSKPEVDKTSDENAPTLFEQINVPIRPVTEKPPNREQVKKLLQKSRKEPTIDEPPNAEAETVTKEDVTLRQKNESIMGVPTAVHLPVTGSTPPPAVVPTPAQLPPTSTTTSSIPAAQLPQQQSPVTPVVVPVQQQQVPIQESKEPVSGNQPDDVSDQVVEEVDIPENPAYAFEIWKQKAIKPAVKTPVSTPPCENVPKKIEISPKKVETPKKQDTSDDDLPKSEYCRRY